MERIEVLKTYKLYIGGAFPRTESGRYYVPKPAKEPLGNICLATRKDFRNAVVAARKAVCGWSARTAYNRSQILYRMAEMMEGRKAQFTEELVMQGSTKEEAAAETMAAIDRAIYYAGWCDKFTQITSTVNPVASPHFNFTAPVPTGVVAVLAPEKSALLGCITACLPVIASGNSCVVLASESRPLSAITLAEVLHSSDLPGGVVNILTGKAEELLPHMASHMDVNALLYFRETQEPLKEAQLAAVENLKRVVVRKPTDLFSDRHENPFYMEDFVEMKTTWHPIEIIGPPGSSY